jgi:hypothetical protein
LPSVSDFKFFRTESTVNCGEVKSKIGAAWTISKPTLRTQYI